ncbi:hypothetical protein PEDI_13860 [Persicobacter diffluens]|uniref:BFN domain-containing protein n=2 Tax=Persicobacter TaxID=59740 RepID=A0AAN5AJC5_9BACT|nr:hypothetical protein PEDI_13860 [Persicobacter diffluens]
MFEAQAIAIEIEKIIPNRPMTHDLFKSIGYAFNFTVVEILISDLREGVFYAKIVCNDGLKNIEIDARPSDAIAIGLRFSAPIYTYERILGEAGIVLTDEEEDEGKPAEKAEDLSSFAPADNPTSKADPVPPSSGSVSRSSGGSSKLKNTSLAKLNEMLEKAIMDEDYEKAAEIRDEINKRQ